MSPAAATMTIREHQIRLYLMAVPFSENFTDWHPSKIERLENYGLHERLNLRAVKLFTDGMADFCLVRD
jgi:hypothetical protein